MKIAEVNYLGNLRCEGIHLKSGNKVISDAPVDNAGKGEAFSPTDLVSSALASCMITVMGIEAEKQKLAFKCQATVEKLMRANPRAIAIIRVELNFFGSIPFELEETFKNIALNCPVALSLSENLKQDISFNFR